MSSTSPVSIAVLDDYAGNSHRHFQSIHGLKVDYFPDTLDPARSDGLEALVSRLRPYSIISTMRERTPFPAALQKQLPNLKLLLTTGMRNAGIDLAAASELGITVVGTKGDRKPSTTAAADDNDNDRVEPPPPPGFSAVNQHAWALLLALCSRIPADDRALRSSSSSPAWQSGTGVSIAGKTLGIVGLGKLGAAFAAVGARAFGMRVVAWSANLDQSTADAAAVHAGLPAGSFVAVDRARLFREADVVSLHYVLSPRSRGVVGRRELAAMKPSAVLVNTSRGPLVDEDALIETLTEGRIRGVALDVFWEEPLSADSAWRRVDSWAKSEVVMSPHMGYVNEGTMNRWYEEQADILRSYLQGDELPNKMN